MRYASQTDGPEQFYSGIRGEHKTLQKLRREQIWLRILYAPHLGAGELNWNVVAKTVKLSSKSQWRRKAKRCERKNYVYKNLQPAGNLIKPG